MDSQRLDPDYLILAQVPKADMSDPQNAREESKALRALTPAVPEPAGLEVVDRLVPRPEGDGEVLVRVYRPEGTRALPLLVYLHGGGFVLGDLAMMDAYLYRVSTETPCVVVSVDYRLAPEHPYPAGVEDSYAAFVWAQDVAGELGADPNRIALGGHSAGGALAAAVAQIARDRQGPRPIFQLLNYPVTDNRLATASMREFVDSPIWDRTSCERMWEHYLPSDPRAALPYAAPNRAEDLSGLPPAYVSACELDPLRDEAIQYALRLQEAGSPVELHLYPKVPHAFDLVPGPTTERCFQEQVGALRKAFGTDRTS